MSPSFPRLLHADGRCEPDPWRWQREAAASPAPVDAPTLLPLAVYLAAAPAPQLAPWLAPADDPAALRERLDALPLVAIEFPKFTDGRGYSLAALLRGRFGYRGELRAIGSFIADQLPMLRRVGFDRFALPEALPLEDARAALARSAAVEDVYQTAADGALPAWRRRAAAAATP